MKPLRQELREYLNDRGMTVKDFSIRSGISQSTLSDFLSYWKAAEGYEPSGETVRKVVMTMECVAPVIRVESIAEVRDKINQLVAVINKLNGYENR